MLEVAKKDKVQERPGFLTLRDAFVKAGFKDKTANKKQFKKKDQMNTAQVVKEVVQNAE